MIEAEARLQAEHEASARAEDEAQRLAEETRQKVEAEALRRAEAEGRLKEEAARLQEELEAREQAEDEARQVAEEIRTQAEEAARRRREEAEERLIEAEARLQAEHEASARAEEEAQRLAEEMRQKSEEEALRRAEAEARLQEEVERLQSAQEARAKAEVEALRLVEESERVEAEARLRAEAEARLKAEQARLMSDEEDLTAAIAAPFQNETHAAVIDGDSFSSVVNEAPAKEIEAVFAEKGIVSAEDDGGIPSDVLQRLKSADASEREAALGEVGRVGGDDAFRCISRAFDDSAVEVRNAAAHALFDLQSDRAATFTRALREGTPERRRSIGQALAASGLAKDAIGNLTGESREKTYDAFSLLFLMAKAGTVQPLMQAIEEYPNVEVRIAVVKLLALSGQPDIVPAFRRMAVRGSLPSEVRSAVMEAIYQIGSQARESAPSAA